MKKLLLKKDIYNNLGVLLLPKGYEIILTKDLEDKFKSLGILQKIINSGQGEVIINKFNENLLTNYSYSDEYEKEINQEKVRQAVNSFMEKSLSTNHEAIDKASSIVEELLYNCKDTKWYSHYKTLMFYVDWLYGHAINTALISTIIGIELGYDNEKLRVLALGSILHDIGLTLLPKRILLKEGELNEIERTIIDNHCEMGYSMLQDTGIPQNVKDIILQHHERLDGSGYPNKLKGDEISSEARIVMIAEAFDTVTTDMPYKECKSVEEAIEEMLMNAHMYDEEILSVFSKIMKCDIDQEKDFIL